MTNGVVPPKKRGCLFYGCLTLLVFVLVGAIAGYVLVRVTVNKINQLVADYTETAPAPFEQREVPPAQLAALQARVAAFRLALETQTNAVELVLSADDLNALIGHDPAFKDVQGRLFVIIEGDKIKGRVSLPLDAFGWSKLKGRYLNGMASFKVSLADGALHVTLDALEVKGKPLPATVLSQLQKENLAKETQNDPDARKAIEKFESIQIKDGKVILRTKVKG